MLITTVLIFGMVFTTGVLFYLDRPKPRYHWATKLFAGITYVVWFFIPNSTGRELIKGVDRWFRRVLP